MRPAASRATAKWWHRSACMSSRSVPKGSALHPPCLQPDPPSHSTNSGRRNRMNLFGTDLACDCSKLFPWVLLYSYSGLSPMCLSTKIGKLALSERSVRCQHFSIWLFHPFYTEGQVKALVLVNAAIGLGWQTQPHPSAPNPDDCLLYWYAAGGDPRVDEGQSRFA